MLPPIAMLTTKKLPRNFLTFFVGFLVVAGIAGCAPEGTRAVLKGERLLKEGKYPEAVKKFEEATRDLPENPKAWNYLGLGYQFAGDWKKAVQAYQQALSLDRNLAAARYNLGTLHLERGDFSNAIRDLTTFTTLDAKNPDGWLKLGEAQMQIAPQVSASERGRLLEAARKNIEYSQSLRPSAEALNALGMIQIQRGRAREAAAAFMQALQKDQNYAPALLNLAIVYHRYFNDHRLALVNYRQFLNVAAAAPEAAQVQIAVRQLESELTPTPAARTEPVASTRPQPASVPAPAPAATKPEPSPTRVAVASKTAPTISAPAAQKETPEMKRVPEQTPSKTAASPEVGQGNLKSVVSSNSATTKSSSESEPHEKSPGVLSKLNPATWFKRKPEPTETKELPAVRPTLESNEAVENSEASIPGIPRYQYRSPKKPVDGDRAKAQPFFAKAVKAHRERRLKEAIADYREALKLDPGYFEANFNLALAAREVGDLSATLHAYELALAIEPDSVNARYNFAYALQEAGYFQDAAIELRKLLSIKPNETRAHLLLGNLCAQRLDQPNTAREHYLKVLELEPQHPQGTQIRYWLAAHS